MPTSEDNKQFVLAAYQSFATREKDRIAAYFAPDAEWNQPESNATAVALGRLVHQHERGRGDGRRLIARENPIAHPHTRAKNECSLLHDPPATQLVAAAWEASGVSSFP